LMRLGSSTDGASKPAFGAFGAGKPNGADMRPRIVAA
jgi:hypothetical protein